MPKQIPILGPSSGNDLIQVNPQKNINLRVKIEDSGARSQVTLRKPPGLLLVDSADTEGVGRSDGELWQGKEYFVIGSKLVSIDVNDAITVIGTLLTNSGRCIIVAGRSYLLIVDGTYGYAWDGSTFTSNIQGTDADFPDNPTHCIYVDGYFLVNKAGTDNIYRSEQEDPLDWDALKFEVASASPDDIKALGVYDRDILIPGQVSTQRHYNQGGAGYNFAPYPNSVQAGLVAPYSFVSSVAGGTGLFHTKHGGMMVATIVGGQIIPESTDDDNEEIGSFSTVADAVGSVYVQDNLVFYVLTFPAEDVTKVFTLGRKLPFHRKSYGIGRWRVAGLGYTGKRILAVDYANDNIYELDPGTYTENGSTIECERIAQHIANDQNTLSCNTYEVVTKQGVGLISGEGSDPQISLAISLDGGVTFSPNRSKSMGGIGEYKTRNVWRQLGEFSDGVMTTRIRYTEPTDFAIIGGYAEFT